MNTLLSAKVLEQGSIGHRNNNTENVQYLGHDLHKIRNDIALVLTMKHCVLCASPITLPHWSLMNIEQLSAPRNNK